MDWYTLGRFFSPSPMSPLTSFNFLKLVVTKIYKHEQEQIELYIFPYALTQCSQLLFGRCITTHFYIMIKVQKYIETSCHPPLRLMLCTNTMYQSSHISLIFITHGIYVCTTDVNSLSKEKALNLKGFGDQFCWAF